MKRRDVVRALLTPERAEPAAGESVQDRPRVASHAVRAMGLEIGRLTEEADEAARLRQQLASGMEVVELNPRQLDPSFVTDRIAPTQDADYRRLVESMRDFGQQVPILVRPHPTMDGRYQIAYGHRRWYAAAELDRPVRAVVRALSDADLVIAQGKENSERRNLSFIERACFAANLQARGFDRPTLNAALGVHSAEMTRFLSVVAAVPAEIISAIGPAPKAGRPRWMELASLLARPDANEVARDALAQPSFARLGSDARFEALITSLRGSAAPATEDEVIRNARGEPAIRIQRSGREVRVCIDTRHAGRFAEYIVAELPELLRDFDTVGTNSRGLVDGDDGEVNNG